MWGEGGGWTNGATTAHSLKALAIYPLALWWSKHAVAVIVNADMQLSQSTSMAIKTKHQITKGKVYFEVQQHISYATTLTRCCS